MNGTFDWGLVVLHTTHFMLGKGDGVVDKNFFLCTHYSLAMKHAISAR